MLPEFTELILLLGFWGITFIIFAENGLFFGFFLPGDSLLVAAGLLASQGYFPIQALLVILSLSAILGVFVGYYFGKFVGPKIFKYKKSLIFNPKYITRAHIFYKKYGNKMILFARFLPIIRTFAPIIAGVANMNFKSFAIYNVIGGVLWIWSMLLVGYILGNTIPNIENYILPIIAIIVFISFIPAMLKQH